MPTLVKDGSTPALEPKAALIGGSPSPCLSTVKSGKKDEVKGPEGGQASYGASPKGSIVVCAKGAVTQEKNKVANAAEVEEGGRDTATKDAKREGPKQHSLMAFFQSAVDDDKVDKGGKKRQAGFLQSSPVARVKKPKKNKKDKEKAAAATKDGVDLSGGEGGSLSSDDASPNAPAASVGKAAGKRKATATATAEGGGKEKGALKAAARRKAR